MNKTSMKIFRNEKNMNSGSLPCSLTQSYSSVFFIFFCINESCSKLYNRFFKV